MIFIQLWLPTTKEKDMYYKIYMKQGITKREIMVDGKIVRFVTIHRDNERKQASYYDGEKWIREDVCNIIDEDFLWIKNKELFSRKEQKRLMEARRSIGSGWSWI